MTTYLRALAALAAIALCAPRILAQHPGASGSSGTSSSATSDRFLPSRQIVRAADADQDGAVTRDEWRAFRDELEPREDADGRAVVSEEDVLGCVMVPLLDRTRDRLVTLDDLIEIFERLDANGDYAIDPSEYPAPSFSRPRLPKTDEAGPATVFMASTSVRAADADGDGGVDMDEWAAFVDGVPTDLDGVVDPLETVRWMDRVIAADPEDAGFTTGSVLSWIRTELDVDGDGLQTFEDLQVFFDDLDDDADGSVSIAEMELSFGRGRSGRGRRRAERPPLMPWQRNLSDALALVEATGKPLLICVNSEGEFASDSFARSRYRSADFVALASGFVPVLASLDRRNPRDYDDRGRRIVDPKMGRVVHAEHIALERELEELYLGERTPAPRHLAVDVDGTVLFDIFMVNDLTLVDEALREHGRPGEPARDPSTMSEAELLASPDALHRAYLETAFVDGDLQTRARLASLALSGVRAAQHPELLRLAFADSADEVRRAGAWCVARHPHSVPVELVRRALVAAEGSRAKGALVGALGAWSGSGGSEIEGLRQALVGLGEVSSVIDREAWRVALSWAPARTGDPTTAPMSTPANAQEDAAREASARRLQELESLASRDGASVETRLAFAAALMDHAELQAEDGEDASFFFEDVVTLAQDVAKDENDESDPRRDGRAWAFEAHARRALGDDANALDAAGRALPALLPWAGSKLAAKALEIFAEGRLRQLAAAAGANEPWSAAWVADLRDAHEVLLDHPYGKLDAALRFVDWTAEAGLRVEEARFLRQALRRAPESGELHARLRRQVLRDGGAAGLERAYGTLREVLPDDVVRRNEGIAWIEAAGRHVANGDQAAAFEAYESGAEAFRELAARVDGTSAQEPAAEHYLCLALAGLARLHLDAERWSDATLALREGLAASPGSVWTTDAVGRSPRDTAARLHAALLEAGRDAEAGELRSFLYENGVRLEG